MKWYIWGNELSAIEIDASTFYEALEKARKINKDYNSGQPAENQEEEKHES